MSVKIKRHTGQLPEFWDRSIIFFANMLSIFFGNSDETETLRQQVGTLETYGGRLIPIINLLYREGNNLLVLEKHPDDALVGYFRDVLGFELPDISIVAHSVYATMLPKIDKLSKEEIDPTLSLIHKHPAQWIDGFVSDETLMDVAKALNKSTISSLEGSKRGNNKFLLHLHLSEKGCPVFDTLTASSPNDIPYCVGTLRKKGYKRVVVKAQIGASGIGMVKLPTNSSNSHNVPEHIFFEGPCLVQGWLDDTVLNTRRLGSPSVQMFLNDRVVSLYDITEQILSAESVHEGNLAPPSYFSQGDYIHDELLRQAAVAGSWLYNQGYRGTASVDFLVVERNGAVEVRVCEINARVTGATYPAIIARHLMPHGAWLMRNLRFIKPLKGASLLETLDKAGKLYRSGLKSGVLPINFNLDEKGNVQKGQFLCLGQTLDDCLNVFEETELILPVSWHYDRD